MNLTATVIALGLSGAIFVLASWRDRQPADPINPRLMPWRLIIIASGAASLFLMVHLVTLLGLKTDRPGMY